MATKVSAKDKLKQFVVASGWTLDPNAKVLITGRWSADNEVQVKQDPNVFLRPAAHGGQWRLILIWNSVSTGWASSREGDSIRGAKVSYIPAGVEPTLDEYGRDRNDYGTVGTLQRVDTDWKHSSLWDVLSPKPGSNYETVPLRKTVELLASDPDTAIWLAKAKEWRDAKKAELENRSREERRALAAQPLFGVALDNGDHGYASQFKNLAEKLSSTADALVKADGASNVPVLIADAQKALESLINSLNHEGAQQLLNRWDELSTAYIDAQVNNAVKVDLDS